MSNVTNAILSWSISEEDERVLPQVNTFFTSQTGFISADESKWYGGCKCLERPIAIGAFNHIDCDALVHHIKRVDWEYPNVVQLFLCRQEDDEFELIFPCRACRD